jgi:hypothetical protein
MVHGMHKIEKKKEKSLPLTLLNSDPLDTLKEADLLLKAESFLNSRYSSVASRVCVVGGQVDLLIASPLVASFGRRRPLSPRGAALPA